MRGLKKERAIDISLKLPIVKLSSNPSNSHQARVHLVMGIGKSHYFLAGDTKK